MNGKNHSLKLSKRMVACLHTLVAPQTHSSAPAYQSKSPSSGASKLLDQLTHTTIFNRSPGQNPAHCNSVSGIKVDYDPYQPCDPQLLQ